MRKKDIFIISDNIISPLGSTTADNFSMLRKGISGIIEHSEPAMSDHRFFASLIDFEKEERQFNNRLLHASNNC
jgi:3-oxoacyl-[acyl-carrier-protein] synthase-1